ncbi:MAG: hypothetical protein KAS67_02730, partial [Thermoplasmata archaeon]|nr:hypothetical protein [Thermoplasmata archaeon]
MKKTTSLMLAGMMILSSLISMVGVGSAGTEGIGAAGAGPDIVISNSYTVSGLETLNNVTVTGTGKLIVPPGATFNVTNIFLQSGSIVEISGGIVNLSSLDPAADVMVNGICSYFNMTDGGIIYMKGSGGSSSLFSSQGGNTNIDIIATEGMKITDSFFTLAGGNGYGPASPWTSGNLNGYVSAGGSSNITLDLTKPGGVMYVNNTSFDLLGGNGGDAADGGLPGGSSGGFSAGGDISGHVGAGGSAFFELLSNNDVSLAQNEITLNGGKGGEAGSAADMIYGPTSGAGGAGYSGGAGSPGLSNTPGQMGGDISDYVGAGGSIMVSIIAEKLVANTTILTANGGNGGNAGDGGNGAGWGSAGGGGYSGGGGGSYWHTEGGNGGAITGNVGSGGSIDIDFNITSIAEINHSNIIAIAGNGGQAGSGGSSTGIHGSGGGGGGYSGGGGGGNGGAAGGEAGHDGGDGGPVSGNVGCGADTNVLLDSDVLIVINTSFDLHGGEAGDGGIAGSNSAGVSCGGGGGGSYSAGGGGGRGYSGLTNGVGGSGGVVSASVGDGGDATLLMQSPKPSISATTQVNLTNGINGNGAASSAPPTVGGEGLGRVTSSGAMTETIPMSIPLLLSPENNSILAVNPTCEWLDLHNSTTNGSLSEYYIEIDNDFDFSSPERTNIMTSANYISVPPLADGIYYWRVTANYSIPIGSNAGWSDVWVFTIGDVPPSPSLTTPATNEHITGVYNITAISDPDSINVNFSYFDGGWHFIGAGIYDSGSGMWYYNWDTAGLNLVDINVTANATDDDPAWGNTTNTGIEIDNTAPTPTLLTPSDNEQIRGVYRTTATSDPDTVSVGFNYSDGLWHNIGFGSYDAGNGSWFYDWDTSGLDLSGVIVSVDAMDEVNLLGTDSNTNIIIDNTDPVI